MKEYVSYELMPGNRVECSLLRLCRYQIGTASWGLYLRGGCIAGTMNSVVFGDCVRKCSYNVKKHGYGWESAETPGKLPILPGGPKQQIPKSRMMLSQQEFKVRSKSCKLYRRSTFSPAGR